MISQAPTVTIYVRHSAGCKYEGDELTKRCDCRKWVRWTQAGVRHRLKTNTRSWAEAEIFKTDLINQLTGRTAASDDIPKAKNLRDAVEIFLTSKSVTGITDDVHGKYERELTRLSSFAEGHGVFTVAGLDPELLTRYAATWKRVYPSSQTRSSVRTRCRGFLRYCYEAGWLHRIPALPKITVDEAPTLPLTDDEYGRLLKAAEEFKAPPPPQVVRAVIQLMRWTGLSIRDALTLPTDRLTHSNGRDRIVTKRTKTGTHISVVLPNEVAQEVRSVAGKTHLFWDGKTDIVKSWTKYVFPPLFKAANITKGGNMMSHRLRDTFACDLLQRGVALESVSKLLGHTSIKTTERHYAAWVQERQDRLDAVVEASWNVKKQPHRAA